MAALVLAARTLHVAMGATWLLATVLVALTGRARRWWLLAMLAVAILNTLAGIELWSLLHAGPWGWREHRLVVGTLCAFLALGLQVPMGLTVPREARRLEMPTLWVYRVSALLVVAAAAAMVGSQL